MRDILNSNYVVFVVSEIVLRVRIVFFVFTVIAFFSGIQYWLIIWSVIVHFYELTIYSTTIIIPLLIFGTVELFFDK